MVYLIEEYKNAYKHLRLNAIKKFENYDKNLHEMSLTELNEIVSTWERTNSETIYKWKRDIINYLEWLQEKGIKTNIDVIDKIEFVKAEKEYLIFSTNDIRHYYESLFDNLEKLAAQTGKMFNRKAYYMSYASGLLSFYGMTLNQILSLDLSDVQPSGIIGYEKFEIAKEDMQIILDYKHLNYVSNNMRLIGTKYIRTTSKTKGEIKPNYLIQPLNRLTSYHNESINQLVSLLNPNNLYLLGKHNRVYQYEKEHHEYIAVGGTTPEWFYEIEEIAKPVANKRATVTISTRKKDYVNYRVERDSQIQEKADSYIEANETIYLNKLTEKLNATLDQIKSLTNVVSDIKNEIDLIKK